MAKTFTARWERELAFTATSEQGLTVPLGDSDERPGFSPSALVLGALAGCTGMDAISIMTKKRQRVERYEVRAEGTQREEYPKAFTRIVVEHVIHGTAIDDTAVARAVELSARRYCVVGATLATGDTEINHLVRIIDEQGERTCDCLTIGPRGRGLSHYESVESGPDPA
jgi:putative redox protein